MMNTEADAASDNRDAERDAYRAAGQAYAAAVLGLPIKRVSVRGTVLDWSANQSMSWDDQRSDIAVGLTGVAAVERYGFGLSPDREIAFTYEMATEQCRADFDIANSLAAEIDPGNKHRVLADAWTLATELVTDDDSWDAIRWLAGIIEGVELDGVAVMHIVQGDQTPVALDAP